MDYRSILKSQLVQRQTLNPSFSLRSFAKRLEISPSKLCEFMSGRKSMSSKRASIIAEKLGLQDAEREIFVLTTEAGPQSDRLKKLVSELNGKRTAQRNAWYFGAVKAILAEDQPLKTIATHLGLTELQVENAQRFLRRIQKFYPDRKQITFEPSSVLSRLQDAFLSGQAPADPQFFYLDDKSAADLEREISVLINKYHVRGRKGARRALRWVQFFQFKLADEE